MLAWTLFEICVNGYEAVLHLFFLKSRVHIAKKSPAADALAVLAYTAFLSLYLFFPIPLSDSIGVVIFLIYLLRMAEDPWYVSVLWCLFNQVVSIGTISLIYQLFVSVLRFPYGLLMEPGAYRLAFVLIGNFILFLVFFSLSRVRKDNSPLDWSALLLFFGINALSLFVIETLFFFQARYAFESPPPFSMLYVALILISVFSILLYFTMTSLSRRKHRAELALNQAALTQDYQQSLKELYADMIARQHDFKQQAETLRQLVEQGDLDAARAYFDAYEKKAAPSKSAFVTGNLAMDALLTAKSIACSNGDIAFRLTHYPLNDLPISEVDLCAIVGNLLDNAIEGVNRIADPGARRWIHLSFVRIWDMFYINCENPVQSSTIRKRQGSFLTSKRENPSAHGYGIANMTAIVTANEGQCTFDIRDQTFVASVSLPYRAQENAARI